LRWSGLSQKWRVEVSLLLGPAGSGKTYHCLAGIRAALRTSAEGPPLVLVAPKQATYQLERQFLADPEIPGYTRLHILSFERLAHFIFERLHQAPPAMLHEEGRLMVLRSLLTRKGNELKLFRASARLNGFARQLSLVLRELQLSQLTPAVLNQLAERVRDVEGLSYKLQDLATLLQEYLDWLATHDLQDVDCLLATAAEALGNAGLAAQEHGPPSAVHRPRSTVPGLKARVRSPKSEVRIEHLWVDGFAEFSQLELGLLATLMPYCDGATVALCVEGVEGKHSSWLSHWSMVRKTLEQCRKRLGGLAGVEVVTETLSRIPSQSRFPEKGALQHLERHWGEPQPYQGAETPPGEMAGPGQSLRVAVCVEPEEEAKLTAREILRHVRAGGRYREISVMVRKLEGYHSVLQRVFSRYGIPFFLDRRKSVSHHPLAELARSALRTIAFQWQQDDWFAVLKTGLVGVAEAEIDRLENEALARGWRGAVWQRPIVISGEPELTDWVARLQERIMPPFQRLALAMAECRNKPTGAQLATAVRALWEALEVEQQLQAWAATDVSSTESPIDNSVHTAVWEQMNTWLENVELAFPAEALTVRDWLPILEAGLASLTVGVIPPALDQVLVGAIDRSRNPDIKLALVLGLNETVFPAPPEPGVLLTESDLIELEKHNVTAVASSRHQLGRERFYAYIACTRARARLVLTCAHRDAHGTPLNPSPFLAHVRRLFPSLEFDTESKALDWRESEHVTELIGPALKASGIKFQASRPRTKDHGPQVEVCSGESVTTADAGITHHTSRITSWERLAAIPPLASVLEQLRHFQNPGPQESLSPEMAESLYGPVLGTSVSRMEQFAACPFKFFVHSGLRAEERRRFELDLKEQGTFQHDVLALFHEQLRKEGKRWRDITPAEARERIAALSRGLRASYRDGLLEASEETRFMARILTESLEEFVETLVGWMRHQYRFDPTAAELPFGHPGTSPAWSLELDSVHRLHLHGRIDRVDLCREGEAASCVVVDYKSSQKQLDAVFLQHGLQLQLLAYLNVLRRWPNPHEQFGVARLAPAGVFYVNLRGKYEREANRRDALENADEARQLAYRHTGRFDARLLRQLDSRAEARQGDQFNYRLTKDGRINKSSHEAVTTPEFEALLDSVEAHLKQMGRRIYEGAAEVAPFRKGTTVACDQCAYQAICRIEPWTHQYRTLKKAGECVNHATQ
jgi:ATP-dependent helicase/nuclease subunit B